MRFFGRQVVSISFLLLPLLGLGCGASNPEPISIPVPFSGALTGSDGIVVADGNSSGATALQSHQAGLKSQTQSGCLEFPVFDSDGANAGSCEYCPTSDVVSEVVTLHPIPGSSDGRRDSYTMPVTCFLEGGAEVSAEMECFDYPWVDPTIPVEGGSELRAGACSGIVTSGSGECSGSLNTALMDGRFVGTSRIDNGKKVFVRMEKWLWILPCQASTPVTAEKGQVLAMMFDDPSIESLIMFFDDSGNETGVTFPLYCEGETPGVDEPCGRAIFTDEEAIAGGFEATFTICKGASCITTFQSRTTLLQLPVTVPQFPGGIVDIAPVTEHALPVLCGDLTGDFREAACSPDSQDGDIANIQTDYRCVNVLDRNTFSLLGTLGSSFIISLSE